MVGQGTHKVQAMVSRRSSNGHDRDSRGSVKGRPVVTRGSAKGQLGEGRGEIEGRSRLNQGTVEGPSGVGRLRVCRPALFTEDKFGRAGILSTAALSSS
jgi:hypothetical protein